MGFSRILAEFAEKMWLAENPPEKNTASRKSAEKVGQAAEYNKKNRLVGLLITQCCFSRLCHVGFSEVFFNTVHPSFGRFSLDLKLSCDSVVSYT